GAGSQYRTPRATGNAGGSSPVSSWARARLRSSWTRMSGAVAGTTSSSSLPGTSRSPLSRLFPNSSGLPCSTGSWASGAISLAVKLSKTPSLNTTQFWNTSTNDAPRCACARSSTPTRCAIDVSTERATNRAPAPSATWQADTGLSTEPSGVDGERVPRRDVGEGLLHGLEDRVVAAPRTPAHLLVGGVILGLQLAVGDGDDGHFACSRIAAPSSATWNGFPAILLNPLASTRYAARSSCTSW